jgi:hypothetical protein
MNNPISPAQLAANRANAAHSTGPLSAAGKTIVSLNAVKTGLTGCTVVLPYEDGELYSALIADYEKEFLPVGIQERELVQSLADIRWRLNRIPGLEAALDTYARLTLADGFADIPGGAGDFLIAVEVFNRNEKRLHNIHLHEARLSRRREKELAELRALQTERKAKEAKAKEDEAAKPPQPAQVQSAATTQNGFEFSNPLATKTSPSTPAVETPGIAVKTAA